MGKEKIISLQSKLRAKGEPPVRHAAENSLTPGNHDLLGGSIPAKTRQAATHQKTDAFSAFDSASGSTLSPLGSGMGNLSTTAPVQAKKSKPEDSVRFASGGESPNAAGIGRFFRENNTNEAKARYHDPSRRDLIEHLDGRFTDEARYGAGMSAFFGNASGSVAIRGFGPYRTVPSLQGSLGGGMTTQQVGDMYGDLLNGGRYRELREINALGNLDDARKAELAQYTPEKVAEMDQRFDRGMMQMKQLQLAQLRRLKDKYGVYGSQMHPEDFITRAGPELFADTASLQDMEQLMVHGSKYFDFEHNAEDQEYRTLSNYYNDVFATIQNYAGSDRDLNEGDFSPDDFKLGFLDVMVEPGRARDNEAAVMALGGRGFTEKEQAGYEGRIRKRFGSKKNRSRLFGRFK